MITWNNLDTLESFKELSKVGRVDIKEAMSGDNGAKRVKEYNIPMAEGFTYNFAAKQVDADVLEALAKLANEAQLTEILAKEGFVVMPYMYPDLNVARDLANAGAACIMPLGAPIGSNKGISTKEFIQILIDEIDLPIIVDAGIGRPSQACEAMEMGAAAVMANTAVATAGDVEIMAEAFKKAIEAGRMAYLSGLGRTLTKGASASSPLTGYLRD